MYLYFDKSGLLKEVINDEALRVGNDGANTVFAYFEGDRIINGVYFNILRNGDTSPIRHAYTSLVSKQIPYDANRTLNYFKYFVNYNFYTYTFDSTDLAINGLLKLTIQAYDNSDIVFALGLVPLIVEASAVATTTQITTSEYEDLLKSIANCPTWSALESYIGLSRSDLQGLTLANVKAYIDSYHINKVENTMITGVLITTITLNNSNTFSCTHDFKNTFYTKDEVYTKEESNSRYPTISTFYTKTESDDRYRKIVDSYTKAEVYTQDETDTLINNEKTAREGTDNSLQAQIDAIEASKNVADIVGTYAELEAYNITYLAVNDIIHVLRDETKDDASTYYRLTSKDPKTWSYVGSDGSFYTKEQVNTLLGAKQNITDNNLTTTNKTIVGAINENKDTIINNIGKLNVINLVGTLTDNVITFTTTETYTLKENCTYELDLHFNVAGNIDLDNTMLITINDTTINLQNILNNSGTMKVRDMLQSEKYTNAVGYRWIFNAVYNTVNSNAFFGIPATINKQDIISLSTSEISAKLQGFEKGQIVQDNTSGLFYIVALDFASETRTLVEMPSQFAKTSALTNGNIIVKTASNYADSGTIKTTFDTKANISDLSTVATSGLYSDLLNKPVFNNVAYSGLYSDLSGVPTISTVGLSGSYNDLLNKPTYATVATSGKYSDLLNIPTFATVATSGKYTDLNNIPTFATVATSGSYNDLTNKPTIPTKTSELTNDSNYVNKTDYATNSVGGVVKATPISDISSVVEVKIYNGKLYCPSVPTLDVQVVSALPTTGNSGVIYLVPKSGATQDIYSEFIWVNSAWEELGGFEIDLSGYLTIASAQATYEPLINASNKIATTYITGLASVATSGSYNDLTNKPTYATVASSGSYNDLLNLPALKTVATTGSYTDLINKPSLSTVATSGLYSDLVGTPNMSLYLLVSTAQSTYQPLFTSTNKLSASYVSGLASVATSGSYNDLTNKPTILENFLINGSVDTNGDITFVSLVVADLITAIQSNEVITFVPSNTDLHSIILTTSKEDSGNSIYMLSGSYTTNGTSKITNYDCKISITSGVATGSYSIKEQVDSGGSGFKQTFNVNGSEWGNCYKGLNEMLKEDDMGRPAVTLAPTIKVFKSWQLNNVDVAYPKQIAGANSYSAIFDSYSGASDIANLSWDNIIALAKHKAFDSTHLGQTKQLDIGGVAYTVQIVGVNHDDLTDETGKANLTFQLKYLLATNYAMNDTNTNSGGWEASKMRTNVLPNILSQMPTNIKNAIKSVNKANCKVYNNATITYTSDKLFLLSEAEVFGVKSQAAALEGTQYEYWANNNTATARIKYQGEGGTSVNNWWLRSPRSSGSSYFCRVDTSGSASYGSASGTNGVSLAFDL